jgi:hypothetical protein
MAVRAQLLDASRPTDLVALVERLVRFTRTMTKAVRAELDNLASWLGLSAIESS